MISTCLSTPPAPTDVTVCKVAGQSESGSSSQGPGRRQKAEEIWKRMATGPPAGVQSQFRDSPGVPSPGPCWHRCLGVGGMVPGARCEWTQQKRKLDEHCGHQGIRTLPGQGGPKRPQPLCLDSARSWCPAGEDPLMMMAVGLLDTEQERVGLVGKWRISDPVDQKLENFTEEKQFRIQVVQPLWAPLSNPLCPAASLPHQPGGHSVAFLQRWEPRS